MRKWSRFRLALTVSLLAGTASAAGAVEVPGLGWEGQGADVVLTSLDANPRPDMILMAYDNPAGANTFRYKVGRNLGADGVTGDWAPPVVVPGVGWEGAGAGAAITNLDADSRPELILMAYDSPAGANNFRYKVGFNINSAGVATSWSSSEQVGGLGWEGQGADVLVTSLDSNPRPDMILMAYDNPAGANTFRYKVGFNLDGLGRTGSWSAPVVVPGVGWEGAGAGAALANLDDDPRPELVLMAYDAPAGANSFRWRVGWNLGTNGVAATWDAGFTSAPGVGWEGQGGGIAIANLDADARPDWVVMAYDAPSGANSFRYTVLPNRGRAQRVGLEIDRISGENWLPATVTRGGGTFTPAGIYNQMGVELAMNQHETLANPLPAGSCFSDGDLLSLQNARRNSPPGGTDWHMYASLTTCHNDGILGVMYDTNLRRGFSMFMDVLVANDRQLRTFAHEMGHGLCLRHSDGDAWRSGGPVSGTGRTIMNQTAVLASDWGYGWEAASLGLAFDRSKDRWRPQSGAAFLNCH